MSAVPDVYTAAHKLLETAFKDVWDTYGGGIPVEWENAPLDPETEKYVSVTVEFGEGQQASLGRTPLEFQSGVVIVQVFTQKGTGARESKRLCGIVARLGHMQLSGDGVVVDTYESRIVPVGEAEDHMQENVQVRFRVQHNVAAP